MLNVITGIIRLADVPVGPRVSIFRNGESRSVTVARMFLRDRLSNQVSATVKTVALPPPPPPREVRQ